MYNYIRRRSRQGKVKAKAGGAQSAGSTEFICENEAASSD